MVTRIREKGQVTIPSGIRESLHLTADSVVSVSRFGNGILLTPGVSAFEAVARKFSARAKTEGITLESLLKDLRKGRRS